MVKKILSLGVAFIMLLSVTLVSTGTIALAADMDESTVTGKDMTIYKIDAENAVTGPHDLSTAVDLGNDSWLVIKVGIGKNWLLDSMETMTLSTQLGFGGAGTIYSYVTPLTKAQFEEASSGNVAGISHPYNANEKVNSGNETRGTNGKSPISTELTGEWYGADNYDEDGFLYLALGFYSEITYNIRKNSTESWTLTLKGTKEQTFDTVTVAPEVVEIKNDLEALEQTITLNPDKPFSQGKTAWLLYKFDLGTQFTDVTAVTLSGKWYPDRGTAFGYVYAATEAGYNAAKAEDANTVKKSEQHSLFETDYGKTYIGIFDSLVEVKDASEEEAISFDLTSSLANACKSGVVYLEFVAGNSNADTNNRWAKNVQLTLTVTGVKGEYTAPAKTIAEDNCLVWNNGTYKLYTPATSGVVKLIAASYSGDTLSDVNVFTIDASSEKTNGGYTGTLDFTVADGETLKVFLWENETLVPIKSKVLEF